MRIAEGAPNWFLEHRAYLTSLDPGPKSVGKSTLAKIACSGLQVWGIHPLFMIHFIQAVHAFQGTIRLELKGTADSAEDAKEAFVDKLACAIGYSLPQGAVVLLAVKLAA